MPLDIGLTGLAMPVAEFPGLAREAQARGYRTAWVGEASGMEAIVLSTLIATHTPPGPSARASLLRTFRAFP